MIDHQLRSTLVKVALPLLVLVFSALALFVMKRRGASAGDLGLTRPKAKAVLLWLGLWIVWMIVTEIAIHAFGMPQAKHWSHYPPLIVGLRVLALGVLGPASEELLFRGIFFFLFNRRIGAAGAILICAAGWAAMHYRYEWKTITLVFLDGIILGIARWRSGSIDVPILMHITGNLFSIYQSLGG